MTDAQTTFTRATLEYDEEHERALLDAITQAIFETSKVSDANAIVLRTGETTQAVKDGISTGRWNRSRHEILLIGTRGNPVCPAPGAQWDSAIMSPRLAHSAKPKCFLEMIEHFPNVPKIELNCRGKPRPGWDAWGNEVEEAAE